MSRNAFLAEELLKDKNHFCYNLCSDLTDSRFRGKYRLWAVDGTEIPILCNPDSENFITTSSNLTGYNALHVNIIHDITSVQFVDCAMGHDEQGKLLTLLYKRKFNEPTILVMDRGYESYNTLAHCCNIPNLFFVLHVKQGKAAFREIQKLTMEPLDCPFTTTITTYQRNIDKENGWVYLNTGSRKGKRLSANTRVTRFDFSTPHTINCRDFYSTPNADGEKLLADIAKYTYYDKPGRKSERGTIKPKTFVAFTYRTSA